MVLILSTPEGWRDESTFKPPSGFEHGTPSFGKSVFLISFSKLQVSFSSNFASFFNVVKDNFSVIFSSSNIYFAQNEPIKVNIFETFECSGQNLWNSLCQFRNDMSIPLEILYPFSVPWKITPRYFLAQIYNFLKRSPLKWTFLRLSTAQSKFVKFFMSILKEQVNSSPNFVSLFSVMKDNSSVLF